MEQCNKEHADMNEKKVSRMSGLIRRVSLSYFIISLGTILLISILELGTRALESARQELSLQDEDRIYNASPKNNGPVWFLGAFNFFPYLMYRTPPVSAKVSSGDSDMITCFNGPPFSPKKPEGVWRIVVMGGSVVWGSGVDKSDDTFSARLNSILNSKIKSGKIEVINAGQPGYNSTQELILLQQEIIGYEPDLVIFFDGFNDIGLATRWSENLMNGVYYQAPYNYPIMRDKVLSPQKTTRTVVRDFIMLSHFLAQMEHIVARAPKNTQFVPIKPQELKQFLTKSSSRYRENLDAALLLLQDKNIQAVSAIQPMILWKNNLSDDERKLGMIPYADLLAEFYPPLFEMGRIVSEKRGRLFWNYADIFRDLPETIYIDAVHFNSRGHEIIANDMAQRILPLLPQEMVDRGI